MNTYLGIDLGTSSVKALLVDKTGKIIKSATIEYPVAYPHDGWSEQNPDVWLDKTIAVMGELLDGTDKASVKGISFGGQMHGLVILDKADKVIRPAILWNDGRTEKETTYLNEIIGKERLSRLTANVAFAGFTAPKILWLKANEKENFARIAKIMLPKDYLAYSLCGTFATDFSDASGTLLLDVQHRKWSQEMCEICGINIETLPTLHESFDVVGTLKSDYARSLGLSPDVKVIIGAGDNAAASVGTGTVGNGECNVSLGTSGTVFISQDGFSVDAKNALHSFCHADGKYHLMGCILSAASCNKWWMQVLNSDDFAGEQREFENLLGNNNVFFLPYLMGERSPHNDVNASGTFIGIRPNTTRKEMTLSVLEGVAFALRDCVEVAKSNGINVTRTRICGGGAKSEVWRKIISNVLAIPVSTVKVEEGPAYGATILAMVGCKEYNSIGDAVCKLTAIKDTVYPDEKLVAKYEDKYQKFTKIYPALKQTFEALSK